MPVVLVLVVVAFGALAVVVANRMSKARDAHARQVAARAGLLINTGRLDPPDERFDVFTTGHSRRAQYLMWKRDDPHEASVFQYQYTTGSGDDSRTFRYTCAYLGTGLNAPLTRIGPEGFFSGLLRAVGLRDIEVESPTFNSQYRVRCADDRFAITLLEPLMVGWFLERGNKLSYQLSHDRAIVVSTQLDIELLPGFLDFAGEFAAHLPKVLHDLYPASR